MEYEIGIKLDKIISLLEQLVETYKFSSSENSFNDESFENDLEDSLEEKPKNNNPLG